jgi:hypothetical protein
MKSKMPDGSFWFDTKDGTLYISAGGQWVPAQQNPPKRRLLGRIWAWLKKLFSK